MITPGKEFFITSSGILFPAKPVLSVALDERKKKEIGRKSGEGKRAGRRTRKSGEESGKGKREEEKERDRREESEKEKERERVR